MSLSSALLPALPFESESSSTFEKSFETPDQVHPVLIAGAGIYILSRMSGLLMQWPQDLPGRSLQ
jgi:hypothetical protein